MVQNKLWKRPRSLAGEVGQGDCLEAQAVRAGHHRESTALAQDLDHLRPFHGIDLGLRGDAVGDVQARLFSGLGQKHHGRRRLVFGQGHKHRAIRSRPEDAIWIADDPDRPFALGEAQNRETALRRGRPTVERHGRTGNRNQRQGAKRGRQNMHRQGNLPNEARRHHITTISNARYVLIGGLSTAASQFFCRRREHAR